MLGRIHLSCEVWAKYIQHTFFILLLTLNSQVAAAEPVDLVRAAPFKNLASSQELKEGYVNLSTKPYDREDLAISLVIPKDWRDIPIKFPAEMLQKATEIFIPLTEQRAPRQEAGNALIEVRYSKLDMEADLSDLVDAFLESFGYEVLMRRQGEYGQRKVEELLVRAVQEKVNYLARLTFSRHGDRVFLVNGSVQEAYIDQYAKILGTAAVSLSVKQKSTSEFAQPMTTFSSKGKPRISIRYPTPYWSLEELEESPAGVTAVSLSLRVKGETSEEVRTYAMIYVEAAEKNAKTPPDQVFKNLKDVFVETGFTFNNKILLADIEPRLNAPLGKLERWDVTVGGLPAEAALLLLPKGNSYLSLGLFSMKRRDNIFGWMTAWRVFEIIAGDLTGKNWSFYPVKKLVMPSDKELKQMLAQTLGNFSLAVNANDFTGFYSELAQNLQNQTTPQRLHSSFRKFTDKGLDPVFFQQTGPTLTAQPYVQNDGVLKLEGFYPSQPLKIQFKLSYLYENSAWKPLGFHISLKEEPIGSQSEPGANEAETESSSVTETSGSDINVLASSRGTKALFATSQYDKTNWRVKNLIDEALGNGHQYASTNNSPQEIVFELPEPVVVTGLNINPFTTESKRHWVKEAELWGSTTSPYSGFKKITEITLDNEPVEQSFTFDSFPLRWVRLMLKSNHGGNLMELGEVKLIGQYTGQKASEELLHNVLAAENGGKVVFYSRQYNKTSWAAKNLIDGKLGNGHGFAMSGKEPGEVVFELPAVKTISHVSFNPFTTESSKTWVKDVEVLVSSQEAHQGFTRVGRFTLHNWRNIEDKNRPLPDQRFEIEPVEARFIKLRMLSNYGGSYIELGEFKAYSVTE